MTRRLLLSCLAALFLTALPAQAETVRWGRSGDAATLDPHAASDAMTMQLVRNIYEPLVAFDPDGSLTGKLAASWLASADDPNVWIFNLRSAVFHDGSAFGADDVAFSFDRARAQGSAFTGAVSEIASVRALDSGSVAIRFAEPAPTMPAAVSDILIMDKEWAEANNAAEVGSAHGELSTDRKANGTGPYMLDSRDPKVRTKLVANARYHSSQPAAHEIIHLPIENPAMQVSALLWGEIDVLQDVNFTDIGRLSNAEGVKVETAPANAVLYLGYRFGAGDAASADTAGKNPFDDPKVREALDRTIDRAAAAAMADHGHAEATAILAPPFVNGWSKGLAVQAKPDRARAKELLAEAGYTDGFAVTFDVADGDRAVANRISSMLAGLGIWANVVARPAAAHEAYLASGESQFYLTDHKTPGYDSTATLEWLVNKHEGYDNAALAEQVAAIGAMTEGGERNAAMAKAWLAAQDERIVLAIAQRRIAHAMREGISVAVDPNGLTRFDTIGFND